MPLQCLLSCIHLPTPTTEEQEHRVARPIINYKYVLFFSVCEIAFLINYPVPVPCEENIPVPEASVCLSQ